MNISKDLSIAKELRNNNELSIAVVRDAKEIYTSKAIGIMPLYIACRDSYDFKDASIADKVIGKGAAMLLCRLNIKSLHTNIISKNAYEELISNSIEVSYDEIVDYIENRSGDGRCPVETMTDTIDNTDDLLVEIKKFLTKIGLL